MRTLGQLLRRTVPQRTHTVHVHYAFLRTWRTLVRTLRTLVSTWHTYRQRFRAISGTTCMFALNRAHIRHEHVSESICSLLLKGWAGTIELTSSAFPVRVSLFVCSNMAPKSNDRTSIRHENKHFMSKYDVVHLITVVPVHAYENEWEPLQIQSLNRTNETYNTACLASCVHSVALCESSGKFSSVR
jgi:hypothetical protein